MSASRITVRSDEATYIPADSRHPVEVLNAGGNDVFYKNAPDVDSGDTKREPGQTVELTDGAWFVTAAKTTELNVREMQVDDFEGLSVGENLTVAGDADITGAGTVGGKFHAEGEVEIEGDLNHDGTKAGFFGTTPDTRSTKITKQEAGADSGLAKVIERVEDLEALLVKLGFIK